MSLSDRYKYVILCEDKQSQCFIRSFLKRQGIDRRRIICADLPVKGCGEQYVKTCYPNELERLRAKNYNRKTLVVCTDADVKSVDDIVKKLEDECTKNHVSQREKKECVMLIIPKRNIETWICYIENDCNLVDEEKDYGHFTGNERMHGKAGERIAEMVEHNQLQDAPLLSLKYFQFEYNRLIAIQKNK